MGIYKFVSTHRQELDDYIRREVPNIGSLNDTDRREWVLNDERLFNWWHSTKRWQMTPLTLCNYEYCEKCKCGHRADEHMCGDGNCFLCRCGQFVCQDSDEPMVVDEE